jgi:hypothetical protein
MERLKTMLQTVRRIRREQRYSCAITLCGIILVTVLWHQRAKWMHHATWVTGLTSSCLGFLNSNAAAMGILLTLAFGVISALESRRRTRILAQAAKEGRLVDRRGSHDSDL